jgi:non-ribosomal peptide synthetase component F
MQKEPGMSVRDALLAVTTISFDIAALEIFLPLLVGARLVLASREATLDGMLLKKLLKDSRATVMQATPTTWQILLESGWEGGDNLKALVGGEAVSPELARSARFMLRSSVEHVRSYGDDHLVFDLSN